MKLLRILPIALALLVPSAAFASGTKAPQKDHGAATHKSAHSAKSSSKSKTNKKASKSKSSKGSNKKGGKKGSK